MVGPVTEINAAKIVVSPEAGLSVYPGVRVDSSSRDDRGWTPLSSAAWGGHEAVVALLMDADDVGSGFD
jgi:ankyrin repeat protein